ncbi:MAG TPA: (2Fe-2S) ferredoxin domain-containing protein [Bacteroidales bacterium]|nr:(2Fe-2S) ferredoxin domain-containing protein [Bacteroidales bacterium]
MEMENDNGIVICLGSSCFSRGNRRVKERIDEYLKENGLVQKVSFRGSRCFDNCSRGPVVRIGTEMYYGVNEKNIVDILDKHFKH